MDDENENADFIDCAGCGGNFYKGDLTDDLCGDCLESDDDA